MLAQELEEKEAGMGRESFALLLIASCGAVQIYSGSHLAGQSSASAPGPAPAPSPSTFPLVVHNLFWKFPCTSVIVDAKSRVARRGIGIAGNC